MRPKMIVPERIRKVRGSYSQIEHRFINGRYIDLLETQEILLYFFLISVGDIKGISFYSSERMASILKIDVTSIKTAREGLSQKGFIAYRDGVYQVLDLPGGADINQKEAQEWTRNYGQRFGGFVCEKSYPSGKWPDVSELTEAQ